MIKSVFPKGTQTEIQNQDGKLGKKDKKKNMPQAKFIRNEKKIIRNEKKQNLYETKKKKTTHTHTHTHTHTRICCNKKTKKKHTNLTIQLEDKLKYIGEEDETVSKKDSSNINRTRYSKIIKENATNK